MDISSISSTQVSQLMGLLNMGTSGGLEGSSGGLESGQVLGGTVDISRGGSFRNWIEGLDAGAKAEMKAFHEEMKAAIESGDFDVTEMAEKAPQALKDHAAEMGIELEEMLDGMVERMRTGRRLPPIQSYNAQGLSLSISEDTQSSLVDSLLEILESEEA